LAEYIALPHYTILHQLKEPVKVPLTSCLSQF